MLKNSKFRELKKHQLSKESDISKEIKVLAEVEKIWIMYDFDGDGTINRSELTDYLQKMAQPELELSTEEINEIFDVIDFDGDGQVDK